MREEGKRHKRQKAPLTWPELIITMTWQMILLVTIGLALVWLASGVSLMTTLLRVALALVSLGLLGWLGNWLLIMALANAQARQAQETAPPGASPSGQEPPAGRELKAEG